jgi:YfiH family protein
VVEWIVPDWPAPSRVRSLVTTRRGGVSQGELASLNLAEHVGDDASAVAENRKRLRRHLPSEPVWLSQVHGVVVADADRIRAGAIADAAVARAAGTVCTIMTADCLPVMLCDSAASVVGAAHAGWRGLAAGVIEATVHAMACPAIDLLAYLGPAIGPDSFEVGDEVRDAFVTWQASAAQAFVAKSAGKWLADLYELARLRLAAQGVTQVFGGGFDTYVDTQRFFSYRRSAQAGRLASLIWLAP